MTTPRARSNRLAVCCLLPLAIAAHVKADDAGDAYRLDAADARFDWQPPEPPPAEGETAREVPTQPIVKSFGEAGSKWWTIGLSGADNFQNAVDTNIHLGYSYFLAKNIEWSLEGAFWHFNQPGDNPVGGSASMLFRWHFVNTGDWTVYLDAGVGLLLASDDVPPGGTSFDFLPQAGVGFTRRLTDDGLRLQVQLDWHHISNARITSDSDNPGRDAAMLTVGLIFPF